MRKVRELTCREKRGKGKLRLDKRAQVARIRRWNKLMDDFNMESESNG